MNSLSALLAVTEASAQEVGEGVRYLTKYEWSRLGEFDDPRHLWLLVAGLVVFALVYVYGFYRRERGALSPLLRVLMPALRLTAILGAIVFFLGPEKRFDVRSSRDSQVIVLVDTSQSMSVSDESLGEGKALGRAAAAAQVLETSSLLAALQQEHLVSVATFDLQTHPIVQLPRRSASQPRVDEESEEDIDWNSALEPQGQETRLGDALQQAYQREIEAPLAGVIVISDGGNNSGLDPLAMAELAAEHQIPLFAVGVGSTQPRRNLRVQQLHVPARVYPDDRTTVRGLIHGEGFAGRTIEVELYAREPDAQQDKGERIGREQITFVGDPELIPVEFDIEPAQVGRLALELRIVSPTDDQYTQDNRREAEVEVVEAQTRVLLISSGPSRDYRFLRNQLRRDNHATVDVWLQSGPPGISQDADQLLDEFPTSKESLYPYDCIVAFDPDWTQLDARQVDMLESWVAEEAGGLIVVAGPIHTSSWPQSTEHIKIRSLYPVEFQKRLTLLDDGLYGSDQPWPIDFSRDGEESEFLWLADTLEESRSLWSRFAGIFGCYAVKGPKPGARVLGRYSDPDAGFTEERPVYLAEHFYGSGRVLYLGSGEFWRLRSLDLSYFEVLYTKLVRHVSQGRLMRGSSVGQLLVERERYSVGDEVVVRARLTTPSREPLQAERVTARVIDPTGKSLPLVLTADWDRPGNYVGQYDLRREGAHRILLSVPDHDGAPLSQLIQAVVPDLEFEKTRRNEALLTALTARTGGRYYPALLTAAKGSDDIPALASLIESRAEIETKHGTPYPEFSRRIHMILLAVICGCLCCEWLLRRLLRLA